MFKRSSVFVLFLVVVLLLLPGVASAQAETAWKVPVGDSPQQGARAALVTLVVFSDFQCPYCARLKPTMAALHKMYSKDLRIVFKHNPLPFHKRAEPAAKLAIHAYKHRGAKGFWAAHDLLFDNQQNLEDADLERMAGELKLNPAAAMQAIRGDRYKAILEADRSLAADVEARGTPTSFINGRRLPGAQPLERFVEVIDAELVKARAMRAKGVPAFHLYRTLIKNAKVAPVADKKPAPAVTSSLPSRGNANAPVTIQIFTDFQCPFCQRVLPTLDELNKAFPGRLRFVFRHRPLAFHKQAPLAHNAAAEAFAQGGHKAFWRMHDWLFANQRNFSVQAIVEQAQTQGLDASAMQRALTQQKHQATIQREVAVADEVGIRGTPGFLINDYLVSGAQPLAKFKRVVRQALKEAR